MRFLIADDDELVRLGTQSLLESVGHQVVAVDDGDQVIQRLAAGEEYDAVITDYSMKITNGDEVLRWIRNDPRCREMKVFVLSGYDVREQISELGGEYIDKIHPEILMEKIRQLS